MQIEFCRKWSSKGDKYEKEYKTARVTGFYLKIARKNIKNTGWKKYYCLHLKLFY